MMGNIFENISLYLLVMAICCSQKLVETLAALAKFDKHSTKHGKLTSSYQDRIRFNPLNGGIQMKGMEFWGAHFRI